MRHRAIAIASALLVAGIAEANGDTFTGCWPITIANAAPLNPPSFARYPSVPSYGAKPAPVNLASHPRAKTYRTMLRDGAKSGPNFAGQYTIVGWGCGTSCLDFAIVDARSGAVYFPPFGVVSSVHVDTTPGEPEPTYGALRYRVDSSLLVVLGAPGEAEELEGISYYHWNGKKLVQVRHLKSLKDRDC